ncbi:DNA repair protein [Favolaschia claudopus]|uniref:DNA repair protein n=1 Tax=Favolaschia claudopus TaxID=2862362 RepID=A0AAW0DQ31_9AGAR
MTYTLLVNIYSQAGKEAEVKAILAQAAAIYVKDKGTLAWFVMQDTKDPTSFAIVERYEQESDVETHHANPHYSEVPKLLGPVVDPARPPKISYYNEFEPSSGA